jgi:hypothetical protein
MTNQWLLRQKVLETATAASNTMRSPLRAVRTGCRQDIPRVSTQHMFAAWMDQRLLISSCDGHGIPSNRPAPLGGNGDKVGVGWPTILPVGGGLGGIAAALIRQR